MAAASSATSIHEFTVKDSSGKDVDLSTYKGKVLLIVNVASQCYDHRTSVIERAYLDLESSYDHRTSVIERAYLDKKKEVEEEKEKKKQEQDARKQEQDARKQEQKLVIDSATELGVHLMEGQLWNGVVKICMHDDLRNIFLCTPVEARLSMIKLYAATDVEPSDATEDDGSQGQAAQDDGSQGQAA
nr:uncharacterized protein LOC117860133 isoform X1 [Setaria viridis]